MYDKERIINTFLAQLSIKIEEIEKLFGRNFDPSYVEILVVDNLPTAKDKSGLKDDLLDILLNQGWQIEHFKIELEKPAIIRISFQISP